MFQFWKKNCKKALKLVVIDAFFEKKFSLNSSVVIILQKGSSFVILLKHAEVPVIET
jgi:hypothetical protein